MERLRVLLVTSWETACGIADYAQALKENVEAADPGIEITPDADTLDPLYVLRRYCMRRDVVVGKVPVDVIHLNHHDALHNRWTPEHVRQLNEHVPVVVTYHDTRSGKPGAENSDKLKAFAQVASSVIVHEPVADLKAIVWRHGIPAAAMHPANYTCAQFGTTGWVDGTRELHQYNWKAFPQQPVLGTVGFNFPWKNFDRLCETTFEEGWALVILSNDATEADELRWKGLNPYSLIVRQFLPQPVAINYLAGCDATAFMYECANNGTSGAIRQGIAARKPVLALRSCRQFRDLLAIDEEAGWHRLSVGPSGICWVDTWADFRQALQGLMPHPWQAEVTHRAHLDSWAVRGRDHAQLYRMLAGESR